ncbi:hypothetical protein BKA24_001849 [Microbacterium marinum]|uniref:Uncharacterized protein n=1 Tax=Microbacterium marinum TaxID=421115 RepID=A0A7W7BQW1_9MICO|nr:hypothetical protein [Microbacterium marinum]MBB4667140.1 hypothetical protein [Microbacterium marinum]
MGLFSSRPEEPSEWAGLPSEPLPDRTDAELLSGEAISPWRPDLLGAGPEHAASIEVPVTEFLPLEGGTPGGGVGEAGGDGD